MIDPAVLIIGALAVIVAVAAFSRRTGIAAPFVLLLVGVAAGYLPGMPDLTREPTSDVILDVVLPALLYASAVNLPAVDFRRNLPAIGGLAVVLVLISTVVVGLVLYAVFKDLRLAAAIAVGAVVSPTDAVAATSIAKRLGLPERLITVLEGESLVNDATALVLLRSATAAVAGSAAIGVGVVAGGLAYSIVVATAIGVAVGYGTVAIRARISDPVLTTAISFTVPFIAFLPANQLGASGVLAAVAAGLVTGHRGARSFAPAQRINDHTNWRTVQFVLEEGVFLAMGLQFKPLLEQLRRTERGTPLEALLVGLLVVAVLVALRAAYVLAEVPLLRWRERRIQGRAEHLDAVADRIEAYEPPDARRARRKARVSRSVAQKQADAAFLRSNGLSLRGGTVVAWSGMRGVVTLAAAQSLPEHLPYRALLVMIAFVVAVVTLLGFGGTLPLVIRLTGVRSADETATKQELRSLLDHVHGVSMAVLDDPKRLQVGGARPDPEVLELLRTRFTRPDADDEPEEPETGPGRREQYVVLRRRMREAAREELLDARTLGSYSSAAIATAQDLLDLNDAREDRLADEF